MQINYHLLPADFTEKLNHFWQLSATKIKLIQSTFVAKHGSPVFTENGRYQTQGWTDWTQGFLYGSKILQFEATGENEYLDFARQEIADNMEIHLTHMGVHDHGFNTVSTYGNLWRLMKEGIIPWNEWENRYYELALKVSGAVQANRWTPLPVGGFIYSFNGPHSLFVDTIRTLRILVLSHELGHILKGENDKEINLLERANQHGISTAKYSIYYGEGRDRYDNRGRTAHESIFNIHNGEYRCPNSQQGYSGFSTWTRGLSWAVLGFAEQLEYLRTRSGEAEIKNIIAIYENAAKATADFYIEHTTSDGIPYWDTGDPNLIGIEDYYKKPSDPFNGIVPVDSSAAAIAAQGLLRLGSYLKGTDEQLSNKYFQAGLTVASTLFDIPYLSNDEHHQGLLLHSVYHFPKAWDYQPGDSKIPYGEATMWGDYHGRELAVYLGRLIDRKPYHSFLGPTNL